VNPTHPVWQSEPEKGFGEFRIPDSPGEGLGNSGVYVHGI